MVSTLSQQLGSFLYVIDVRSHMCIVFNRMGISRIRVYFPVDPRFDKAEIVAVQAINQ
jgi:hypothetical protein